MVFNSLLSSIIWTKCFRSLGVDVLHREVTYEDDHAKIVSLFFNLKGRFPPVMYALCAWEH